MSTETKTPRTDAVEEQWAKGNKNRRYYDALRLSRTLEAELAAAQAQIAEVLNLAKKWRKKFQFNAAEEVEKIFKANPPPVVSREEHNRALAWINDAANLLPSLASMSSGQEREVQVLMGRHLVDEARLLDAHEARKGGEPRPCPNPACCGTGSVEIHNGPHVRKCKTCNGLGTIPNTTP